MRKHLFMAALTVFSVNAFAATPPVKIKFADNETVTAKLSSVDINRIAVKDDKITSVTCPTGFCTLPMSGEASSLADPSGAALVALNVMEPFTFYVTTQKGRSFGVFVTPLRIPAGTTQFISKVRDTKVAAEFEKKSPYQQMIADLMRHMMRFDSAKEVPTGFVVSNIKYKPQRLDIEVVPMRKFDGDNISGLTLKIKNNTNAD
ncbi:type-F conjugative transfer system secretin TraK, partial [Shewanella sairae]|uniref:type-F conjugative transfer system secretin TraK n=1 Tax=Shewanella sairae TaxID=190310 RepID=UPI001C819E4C